MGEKLWLGMVLYNLNVSKLQDPTLINTRRVNTLLYSVHVCQWVLGYAVKSIYLWLTVNIHNIGYIAILQLQKK